MCSENNERPKHYQTIEAGNSYWMVDFLKNEDKIEIYIEF